MRLTTLLISFCMLFVLHAEEMDSIDVTMIGDEAVTVAVTPFQTTNGVRLDKNKTWAVLASDLDFSPNFNIVRTDTVDSAIVVDKAILLYVTGTYSVEADTVTMTFYLHDPIEGDTVDQQMVKFHKKSSRKVAHDYANALHDRVFAEKGPFLSRIAYTRRSKKGKNVYIMDYDGANSWAVTRGGLNIMPTFYGKSGLFWISYERGKPDLFRASLSSGKTAVIASTRKVETSPEYNSVVDRVVFASSRKGNMDVYSVRPDGSGLKQITVSGGIDGSPCWSPNGFNIAFVSDRSGSPQIYVMDKDGGSLRKLTYNSTYNDSPSWSPDGERIAYTSIRGGKFSIFTIAVDGTDEKEITKGVPGNNRYPTWSPDGSHIAFSSSRGSSTDIYIVAVKSGKVTRITKTGDAEMPNWSVVTE